MSLRLSLLGLCLSLFGAVFIFIYGFFIPFFVLPTFLTTRLTDELVIEKGDVLSEEKDRNLHIFTEEQWPPSPSSSLSSASSSSPSPEENKRTGENSTDDLSSSSSTSSSSSLSPHNYSPYTFFYLFEVMNPKDVVLSGASPRVVERGPFGYRRITQRQNLSFSQENTENTFNAITYYRPLSPAECSVIGEKLGERAPPRAASCLSEETQVTTFNPAFAKLLGKRSDPSWIYGKLGYRAMTEIRNTLTSADSGLLRNLRFWRLSSAFQLILQENLMSAIPQLLARVTRHRGERAREEFASYAEVDCGPDNSNRLTAACSFGIGKIMLAAGYMANIYIDDAHAVTPLQALFLLDPSADQMAITGYPAGTGAITVTAQSGTEQAREQLERGFLIWRQAFTYVQELGTKTKEEGSMLQQKEKYLFLIDLLCLWRRATERERETEEESRKICEVNVRGVLWYLFGQVELRDDVPVYKGWLEQDIVLTRVLEQWRGVSSLSSSSPDCQESSQGAAGKEGGEERESAGSFSLSQVCDWSIQPFLLRQGDEREIPSTSVSRLLLDPFETFSAVGETATAYPSLLNPYKLAVTWGGVASFCEAADLDALGSRSPRSPFLATSASSLSPSSLSSLSPEKRDMSCPAMQRWASVVRRDLAPSFALADGVKAEEYDKAGAEELRARYERMVCSIARYVKHWATNSSWYDMYFRSEMKKSYGYLLKEEEEAQDPPSLFPSSALSILGMSQWGNGTVSRQEFGLSSLEEAVFTDARTSVPDAFTPAGAEFSKFLADKYGEKVFLSLSESKELLSSLADPTLLEDEQEVLPVSEGTDGASTGLKTVKWRKRAGERLCEYLISKAFSSSGNGDLNLQFSADFIPETLQRLLNRRLASARPLGQLVGEYLQSYVTARFLLGERVLCKDPAACDYSSGGLFVTRSARELLFDGYTDTLSSLLLRIELEDASEETTVGAQEREGERKVKKRVELRCRTVTDSGKEISQRFERGFGRPFFDPSLCERETLYDCTEGGASLLFSTSSSLSSFPPGSISSSPPIRVNFSAASPSHRAWWFAKGFTMEQLLQGKSQTERESTPLSSSLESSLAPVEVSEAVRPLVLSGLTHGVELGRLESHGLRVNAQQRCVHGDLDFPTSSHTVRTGVDEVGDLFLLRKFCGNDSINLRQSSSANADLSAEESADGISSVKIPVEGRSSPQIAPSFWTGGSLLPNNVVSSLSLFLEMAMRTITFSREGEWTSIFLRSDLEAWQRGGNPAIKAATFCLSEKDWEKSLSLSLSPDQRGLMDITGVHINKRKGEKEGKRESVVSVLLSLPHLLYNAQWAGLSGSREWQVGGLVPNPEIHRSCLDVEPVTGQVLKSAVRFQVNYKISPSSIFPNLSQELLIPLYWRQDSSLLPEDWLSFYSSTVVSLQEKARTERKVNLSLGFFPLFFGLFLLWVGRSRAAQKIFTWLFFSKQKDE